jgi:hypothetical protein
MPFLANLLYRHKDPTRDWVRAPEPVVIDLRKLTVAGAHLGGPIEGLRSLGRTTNAHAATRGHLYWSDLGVSCEVNGDMIEFFEIPFIANVLFRPFNGRFTVDGRETKISRTTTQQQLTALLGPPFATSNVDDDIVTVLFYESEHGEAQFAFGADTGELESIELWDDPELDHDPARADYGITAPAPNLRRKTRP